MGNLVEVSFELRPHRVEKAARAILTAMEVDERYQNFVSNDLIEEEKTKALNHLSDREKQAVAAEIQRLRTAKRIQAHSQQTATPTPVVKHVKSSLRLIKEEE